MTEETKEILDYLKRSDKNKFGFEQGKFIDYEEVKTLLDYITNLQQDLDNTNDIIEKDRQFYKCRMDEYVELKKENETLKAKLEIGKTCGFCPYYHYKSRCKRANKWVDKHTEIYTKNGISIIDWDNLSDPRKLKNILNGSDENE